jgi:hypothetical protein
VGLKSRAPLTDYRLDPTGDGLDQCACDALTLWPFAPPTQQSATRRE